MAVAVAKAVEAGATRDRVRIDREHRGVCGGVRSTGRDRGRSSCTQRADRPARSSHRCARPARAWSRSTAPSTTRSRAAEELAEREGAVVVNSTNPDRIEGQKTAALEIIEQLGGPPDVLALPYGGGGNTVAYAKGFLEAAGALAPAPSRRSGRPRDDERLGDPHPDSGPPRRGRGGARPLRRRGRLGHRRRDRRGLEVARAGGGHLLRAGVRSRRWPGSTSGLSPRARASCSCSPATGSRIRTHSTACPRQARDPRARSRHDGEPRARVSTAPAPRSISGTSSSSAKAAAKPTPTHLAVRAFARLASARRLRLHVHGTHSRARAVSARARRRSRSASWQARSRPASSRGFRRAARTRARPRGPSGQSRRRAGGRGLPDVGGSRRADRRRCTRSADRDRPARRDRRDTGGACGAAGDDSSCATPRSASRGRRCSVRRSRRGSAELFAAAADDRLHEPYRAPQAPHLAAVREQLPDGALGATLSGSGPTVIVWARAESAGACRGRADRAFPRADVLHLSISPTGAGRL